MYRWSRRLGLLVMVCLLQPAAAQALTITVESRSIPSTTPGSPLTIHKLRLTGMFEPGSSDRLRLTLASLDARPRGWTDAPLATAEMSSSGGDLVEGLKIGYLFSEFNVATVVRKGDRCLSACALAFLGGTASRDLSGRVRSSNLEIGGGVGFHNFATHADYFRQRSQGRDASTGERASFFMARAGAALIVQYAADMDIDPKLIGRLLGRPSEEFEYIRTVQDFLSLGVCPIGFAAPSTGVAEQATNICRNSVPGFSLATPSRTVSMTPQQARRHLLEHVQSSMLSFRARGALSDQLASHSVMRNPKAIENLYADLRAAAVPLPEIVGPVFEVDDNDIEGLDGLSCVVSLAPDNPRRYDVAVKSSRGLARAPKSAPEECRGLFRHDRDAVINP